MRTLPVVIATVAFTVTSAVTTALPDAVGATSTPVAISIRIPHHGLVNYDAKTSVSGRVTTAGHGLAGQAVALQANRFPYKGFVTVRHATTSSTGSFSFVVQPALNTRYRVVEPGTAASPVARATEEARFLHCHSRDVGSSGKVSCLLHYPRSVREAGKPVYWYFANKRTPSPAPRYVYYSAKGSISPEFKPGWSHISFSFAIRPGYWWWWGAILHDQPAQGLGLATCSVPWDRYALGLKTCPIPHRLRFSTLS
ncbi:MAG: hypothetical protein ACRDPG_01585 [Nocardioidaceae bacterium]